MRFVKPMSRSVFRFRYPVKGSFNLGEICPIGAPIEVIPGDEFKIDLATVIRMATPIAPIMDDLDAEITAHYVPLRLIGRKEHGDVTNMGYVAAGNWTTFESLIGNGLGNPADWDRTNTEVYTAPTSSWNPYKAKTSPYTSIGEALGLGVGIGTTALSSTKSVLSWPLFGYNLIYQERFRNQDVETAKPNLAQGSNVYGQSGTPTDTSANDETYNHSLSVAYKHGDYFTNGKPSPVKGPEIPLILTNNIPVGFTATASGERSTGSQASVHGTYFIQEGAFHPLEMNGSVSGVSNNFVYANLGIAENNINSFITSFNVSRLLMKDIKGTRYFDIVKEHYGVENEDIKIYIPELLNIRRFAINISPVVQQGGTDSYASEGQQPNYLGTVGGYSFTAHKGAMVAHAFGEFGYIYLLIVVRQRHTYGQGIPKLFNRRKRFDFFFPELGRIGYQPIYKSEIDVNQDANAVFAYQPAWEELRRVNNGQTFGVLNPAKDNSLDYWTLTENLTEMPNLEMAFLKENRTNLARALSIGDSGPDFIMDAMVYGTKSTLVPIGNEPKLFN